MNKIAIVQITDKENVHLRFSGATLDEITRALPQGFYTTFSTLSGGTKVMGLRAHLDRLYLPAASYPVDGKTLRARIAALVKENLPGESRVRVILTKETGEMYVAIQPFTPLSPSVYENGVHVVSTQSARHDPRIKDTGFIVESAAQRKLVNKDIFEVLLTKNGKVLEGMTSNFYVIARRSAATTKQPPAASGELLRADKRRAPNDATLITARRGILLGVTRRAVLRIARGAGLGIEYRAPRLDEKFDEAFLTSSSRGVVPIVSIDHHPVGQGSVGKQTKILMRAYWEYVESKSEAII
jgi:branched-chain amino acid aminotransferase